MPSVISILCTNNRSKTFQKEEENQKEPNMIIYELIVQLLLKISCLTYPIYGPHLYRWFDIISGLLYNILFCI